METDFEKGFLCGYQKAEMDIIAYVWWLRDMVDDLEGKPVSDDIRVIHATLHAIMGRLFNGKHSMLVEGKIPDGIF